MSDNNHNNEQNFDLEAVVNDVFNVSNVNFREFIKLIINTKDEDIKVFFSRIFNLGNLDFSVLKDILFPNDNIEVTQDIETSISKIKNLIIHKENLIVSNDDIEPNNLDYSRLGIVTGISDNIVSMVGLYDVAYGEMIEVLTGFESAMGMVLNIEENKVSAIIFSSDINIKPGQEVIRTSLLMNVPVGDNLLGRIVDPLGNPLDSKGVIVSTGYRFMDSMAPSIISRKSVNTPVETGLKLLIVWYQLDMVKEN
jgi:hypothetical protein